MNPSSRAAYTRRALLAVMIAAASVSVVPTASAAAPAPLVVDPAQVGGRCTDARSAPQVTVSRPLCTLTAGLRLAIAGQPVLLRRGTHAAVSMSGIGGSPGVPVTVEPWPQESAGVQVKGISLTSAHDVRLSGMTVDSVSVRSSDRVEISNNDTSSIYLRATIGARVTGNRVHDGARERYGVLVQGIERETRDLVIADNRIWNFTHDGIAVYNGAAGVSIQRNEISGLTIAPGSEAHVDAIQLMPGERYLIADNHIHDTAHGLLVNGGLTRNLVATGNRFVRVGGVALQFFGTPAGVVCRNTVVEKQLGPWALGLYVGHDPIQGERASGVVVGDNDVGRWEAEHGTLAAPSITCGIAEARAVATARVARARARLRQRRRRSGPPVERPRVTRRAAVGRRIRSRNMRDTQLR